LLRKLSGVHLGRQRTQAANVRRKPKAVVYGFPLVGGANGGLKVAHEEVGRTSDPDRVPRKVTAEEIDHTYTTYVQPFLPDLGRAAFDRRRASTLTSRAGALSSIRTPNSRA
jgi:hypothetical protein